MSPAVTSLEERIEQIAALVVELKGRIDRLEAHVGEGGAIRSTTTLSAGPTPATMAPGKQLHEPPADISEEVLSWAGKTSLLPRLATLCFLLVIALVLRTVTDNGMINTLLGSGLGMGYAALLVAAGWFLYGRPSPLAPVFVATGAVLLATIVVETHTRFQSLPLVPAYLTLMAMGIGTAVISYQFKVFVPVSVGTLGMCLAGAAIDYPHPFFPYLSMILYTANLLGYYAAGLKRCSWLRWIVLLVTLVMLQLWGIRLVTDLGRGQAPGPTLALAWYLPVLATFGITYLAIAVMGIVRSGADRVSRFDFSLPTINVLWTFLGAQYFVHAWQGNLILLGGIGILFALAHGGVAWWLAGRQVPGAPGTNSLLFASAVLLAMALPPSTGSVLVAASLLAAAALGLQLLSRTWQSGGVRLTSYLLLGYASISQALMLFETKPDTAPLLATVATGFVGLLGFTLYRWCRSTAPPADSVIFSRYDKHDLSGAIPLLGALLSSFFLFRTAVYQVLPSLPGDPSNAFRCAQSVIINLAAIALMLIAARHRNRELRNVAILVTLVGAAKVFLSDLVGSRGMPLVLSVLSFGVAAALESIILGRWQRGAAKEASGEE